MDGPGLLRYVMTTSQGGQGGQAMGGGWSGSDDEAPRMSFVNLPVLPTHPSEKGAPRKTFRASSLAYDPDEYHLGIFHMVATG